MLRCFILPGNILSRHLQDVPGSDCLEVGVFEVEFFNVELLGSELSEIIRNKMHVLTLWAAANDGAVVVGVFTNLLGRAGLAYLACKHEYILVNIALYTWNIRK